MDPIAIRITDSHPMQEWSVTQGSLFEREIRREGVLCDCVELPGLVNVC